MADKSDNQFLDVVVGIGDTFLTLLEKLGLKEADAQHVASQLKTEGLLSPSQVKGIGLDDAGNIVVHQYTGLVNEAGEPVVRITDKALGIVSQVAGIETAPDAPKHSQATEFATQKTNQDPAFMSSNNGEVLVNPNPNDDKIFRDTRSEPILEALEEYPASRSAIPVTHAVGTEKTMPISSTSPPPGGVNERSNLNNLADTKAGQGVNAYWEEPAEVPDALPTSVKRYYNDNDITNRQVLNSSGYRNLDDWWSSQTPEYQATIQAKNDKWLDSINTPVGGESIGDTQNRINASTVMPAEVQRYLNDLDWSADQINKNFAGGKSISDWWRELTPEEQAAFNDYARDRNIDSGTPAGGESLGEATEHILAPKEFPLEVQKAINDRGLTVDDLIRTAGTDNIYEWWENKTPLEKEQYILKSTIENNARQRPEGGETPGGYGDAGVITPEQTMAQTAVETFKDTVDWNSNDTPETVQDEHSFSGVADMNGDQAVDVRDVSITEQVGQEIGQAASKAVAETMTGMWDDSEDVSEPTDNFASDTPNQATIDNPDGTTYGSADAAEAWQDTSATDVEANHAATEALYQTINEISPNESAPIVTGSSYGSADAAEHALTYEQQAEMKKIETMQAAQAQGIHSLPLANPDGSYSGLYITQDGNTFTPTPAPGGGVLEQLPWDQQEAIRQAQLQQAYQDAGYVDLGYDAGGDPNSSVYAYTTDPNLAADATVSSYNTDTVRPDGGLGAL